MRRTLVSATAGLVTLVTAALLVVQEGDPATAHQPAESTRAAVALAPERSEPTDRTVGSPRRVVIPAIGVEEKLHGVGLSDDGAMEMPGYGDAAWYDEGPRPGSDGPAVIVAHVRGPQGADVFRDLDELAAGDVITTVDTLGSTRFVVDRVEQVDKDALPYDRIWQASDEPLLRLITCAGTPGPNGFPDNTVVYAHAID